MENPIKLTNDIRADRISQKKSIEKKENISTPQEKKPATTAKLNDLRAEIDKIRDVFKNPEKHGGIKNKDGAVIIKKGGRTETYKEENGKLTKTIENIRDGRKDFAEDVYNIQGDQTVNKSRRHVIIGSDGKKIEKEFSTDGTNIQKETKPVVTNETKTNECELDTSDPNNKLIDMGYDRKGNKLPPAVIRRGTGSLHPGNNIPIGLPMAKAYDEMTAAAKKDGVNIYPDGDYPGYRTYENQAYMKNRYGKQASTPGTSEHEKGLAFDMNTRESGSVQWMQNNAGKFGFVRDASEIWHYNYNPDKAKR